MQHETTISNSIVFTPASSDDVPELNKLINSAYRGDSSKKGWTTEAHLLDGIRTDEDSLTQMINKKDARILKCVNETKEIIGCVFLEKQGHQMYLGMLTVSPLIQTKGIGKKLLKASEEYALGQQCNAMTITVITDRTELIAWYERNGYKSTGVTKPFPDDPKFGIPKKPLEFIVMEKPLA